MSQALFGELPLLLVALGWMHRRTRTLAVTMAAAATLLLAVYVDAYHVEPRLLRVREHVVEASGERAITPLRILHITDLQTPAIGAHEIRALTTGLAYRPDLIVLTGDYVQDDLGRPTEHQAMQDLRALMSKIRFEAPLGVYATDGDAGPSCREVFAGTSVVCLVDASVSVPLIDGSRLAITGLSRDHGRERNSAWLAWLLGRAPPAEHRLVIAHAPDFVDALPYPVDLVLAGHTHGGQVVLPFFGPPITASRLPRKFAGGLHDFRGTPLHVSRGVGMERAFTPPVRFLCPPEICVLDVRLRGREAKHIPKP
jgi:predicted MPP superfamily phosphohydrolase